MNELNSKTRKAIYLMYRSYVQSGRMGPDPRKHSKARKPRATDAGTGYKYDEEGKRVQSFIDGRDVTKAVRSHMRALGLETN